MKKNVTEEEVTKEIATEEKSKLKDDKSKNKEKKKEMKENKLEKQLKEKNNKEDLKKDKTSLKENKNKKGNSEKIIIEEDKKEEVKKEKKQNKEEKIKEKNKKEKVQEDKVENQENETSKEKNLKDKSVYKEIEKKISTRVFINLLIAIGIMAYFCILGVVYKNIEQIQLVNIVKVMTMVYLAVTIVLIEIAYRKESLRFLIHSGEALALSIYTLTTMHIIKVYNVDFQNYVFMSSYIFSIYFVLKTIIINTKARRDYVKGLSDIAEIVKKDEPQKKEAKKREVE